MCRCTDMEKLTRTMMSGKRDCGRLTDFDSCQRPQKRGLSGNLPGTGSKGRRFVEILLDEAVGASEGQATCWNVNSWHHDR